MSALEAASAENATQLRASEEEHGQLTERLSASETLASGKAAELHAAQVEISEHKDRCRQLEQEMATAEAKVVESQGELRKVRMGPLIHRIPVFVGPCFPSEKPGVHVARHCYAISFARLRRRPQCDPHELID